MRRAASLRICRAWSPTAATARRAANVSSPRGLPAWCSPQAPGCSTSSRTCSAASACRTPRAPRSSFPTAPASTLRRRRRRGRASRPRSAAMARIASPPCCAAFRSRNACSRSDSIAPRPISSRAKSRRWRSACRARWRPRTCARCSRRRGRRLFSRARERICAVCSCALETRPAACRRCRFPEFPAKVLVVSRAEGPMRHFAGAFVCALFVLGLGREAAHAQSIAPTTAPKFEAEPFSGAELLRGKRITQAECAALSGAVWVTVDQQGECIRYYHSTAGGSGPEAVVFFSTEVASTNARSGGEALRLLRHADPVRDAGPKRGVVAQARNAVSVSCPTRHLRPRRRTPREIDLISAALDAIKSRHGYTRLHLAGSSEGGHAAAALLARRTDLGCVVLASSLLSVHSGLAESGWDQDVTGNKHPVDPVALVDQVVKRPGLRIIVVTDPDDIVISARSQTLM